MSDRFVLQTTPSDWLYNHIYVMTEKKWVVAPRALSILVAPIFEALSALQNASCFVLKLPFVVVKYTVGQIPFGSHKLANIYPKGFEITALGKHFVKTGGFIIFIFITPILGAIAPGTNVTLHNKVYLITLQTKVLVKAESKTSIEEEGPAHADKRKFTGLEISTETDGSDKKFEKAKFSSVKASIWDPHEEVIVPTREKTDVQQVTQGQIKKSGSSQQTNQGQGRLPTSTQRTTAITPPTTGAVARFTKQLEQGSAGGATNGARKVDAAVPGKLQGFPCKSNLKDGGSGEVPDQIKIDSVPIVLPFKDDENTEWPSEVQSYKLPEELEEENKVSANIVQTLNGTYKVNRARALELFESYNNAKIEKEEIEKRYPDLVDDKAQATADSEVAEDVEEDVPPPPPPPPDFGEEPPPPPILEAPPAPLPMDPIKRKIKRSEETQKSERTKAVVSHVHLCKTIKENKMLLQGFIFKKNENLELSEDSFVWFVRRYFYAGEKLLKEQQIARTNAPKKPRISKAASLTTGLSQKDLEKHAIITRQITELETIVKKISFTQSDLNNAIREVSNKTEELNAETEKKKLDDDKILTLDQEIQEKTSAKDSHKRALDNAKNSLAASLEKAYKIQDPKVQGKTEKHLKSLEVEVLINETKQLVKAMKTEIAALESKASSQREPTEQS